MYILCKQVLYCLSSIYEDYFTAFLCVEGSLSTSDLVAFLSGLLLGGDTKARNWFSSFVRIGQKVCKPTVLFTLPWL